MEKQVPLNTSSNSNTAQRIKRVSGLDNEVNVRVAVRCRPMSKKEKDASHQSIVEFEGSSRIIINNVNESPSDQLGTKSGARDNVSHMYDFDAVFNHNTRQEEVYNHVCAPIIDSVLQGYNGTIFAYGQTGTGKTYTMEGASRRQISSSATSNTNKKVSSSSRRRYSNAKGGSAGQLGSQSSGSNQMELDDSLMGIIPRAFRQIFKYIGEHQESQFLIRASYLEIYQEDIHDLLKKDRSIKLEIHERPDTGVYVKDLTSFVCKSISDIEKVMKVGSRNRMVGATDMNEHSSRSHAIFVITIEQQQQSSSGNGNALVKQSSNAEEQLSDIGKVPASDRVIKVGKLNLVDLAGSERQRKTNSFGQRQRESIKINLSLSALGNVINALMKLRNQQQSSKSICKGEDVFVPYRDSKLTRLLQDSLGGNAKTLMIANIGPASYNYDETINTLDYASRAKCIRNKPRLNEDPKDALLRELQREIDDLRTKLAAVENDSSKPKEDQAVDDDDKMKNEPTDSRQVEKELRELKEKLSSLEDKLLNGEKSDGQVLDQKLLQGYTYEQELELRQKQLELANQADRERAIREELERREEAELVALESFSSIQQEVDAKRGLIKQILHKIKTLRDEVDSSERAYRLELDELDQLQYVLSKELKLKCLIMDNFIPNSHVDQLLPRIVFDEKRNCCTVKPVSLKLDKCVNLEDQSFDYTNYWRLVSDPNCPRPRSEYEKLGETIYPNDIRFKYDNLIEPMLDIPVRNSVRRIGSPKTGSVTTKKPVTQQSNVQDLINEALSLREPDIVI